MSGKGCGSRSSTIVRLVAACLIAGASTAACATASNPSRTPGAAAPSPTATGSANPKECLVGVSWWGVAAHMDYLEPSLLRGISAGGARYVEENANAVAQEQAKQIDKLVAAGVRVIVIEPADGSAYLPAIQRAIEAGIPVISLVKPLEHVTSLYVDFDPVEQGRQEASALLAVKPRGTYAIVTGNVSYPQTSLVVSGIHKALQPAADRGDIRIVAEAQAGNWQPDLAQQEMSTILGKNGGHVDAVAVDSRDVAWGVRDALKEAGLAGKVALASTGTTASTMGLSNVADGTQTVEVWGNPEWIGDAAARAALALCHDPDITKVAGSAEVTWAGGERIRAILLAPEAVTKDNLAAVLQANPNWRPVICGNPPPPGRKAACEPGP